MLQAGRQGRETLCHRLKLSEVKASSQAPQDFPAEVLELVEKRAQAKRNKDWASADLFRNQIEELGYTVKDTPAGPSLQKKM